MPQGKVHVTFIAQAAEPTTIYDVANKVNHEIPKDILPQSCWVGQDVEVAPGENLRNFELTSK